MSRRALIGVIAGLGVLTGASVALAQQYTDDDGPPPPRMGWNRALPMPRGPMAPGPMAPRPMAPGPMAPRALPPGPAPDAPLPPANVPIGPGPNEGFNGDPLLPPRAIIGSLMRRGFNDVDIKRVRGDSYIVMATGPEGGRVLVVVDGHTTEITGLRQLGWDRPAPPRRWDDGGGWLPPRPWGGPRW